MYKLHSLYEVKQIHFPFVNSSVFVVLCKHLKETMLTPQTLTDKLKVCFSNYRAHIYRGHIEANDNWDRLWEIRRHDQKCKWLMAAKGCAEFV